MTEEVTSEQLLAVAISAQGDDEFPVALNTWLRWAAAHDNTTILAYFQDQTPRLLMTDASIPQVHQHFNEVYLAGAYLLDPYYELHRKQAEPGLYRIFDIVPDQFSRNRYFIEYYRRTTILDEIAYVVCPSPGLSLHVCLGRDTRSGQRFSARERAAAARIVPIVDTLVRGHWGDLRFDSDLAEESVTARVIRLVDEAHGIALTNRQAEVALLVLQGHSSVSIGLRLGISAQTVKVFRKQLYKRCQVGSQAELFSLLLPLLGR